MWSRRRFLSAAGMGAGAALLSPLMNRVSAAGPACRRFVFVVEGNGLYARSLVSSEARAALDTNRPIDLEGQFIYNDYAHETPIEVSADTLSTALCLDPLAGTAGELSLDDRAAVVLGLSSKITGGGHSSYAGALSCSRGSSSTPAASTIDHVLAELGSGLTPFDAVRIGVTSRKGGRLNYQTCAFGPGRPAPVITDPTSAFNNLFGSVAAGAGRTKFERRAELLDFASEDINHALGEFRGSSTERLKLERYLASLEALTQRQGQLLSATDRLRTVKPAEPSESPLYASDDSMELLQAQFDIASAALLGELTEVVVIAIGTGSNFSLGYPSVDGAIGRHDMHHGFGTF
ncbi:MAG: DUF1552 domain-containing protein, partial [Myxococcota bacterium]